MENKTLKEALKRILRWKQEVEQRLKNLEKSISGPGDLKPFRRNLFIIIFLLLTGLSVISVAGLFLPRLKGIRAEFEGLKNHLKSLRAEMMDRTPEAPDMSELEKRVSELEEEIGKLRDENSGLRAEIDQLKKEEELEAEKGEKEEGKVEFSPCIFYLDDRENIQKIDLRDCK